MTYFLTLSELHRSGRRLAQLKQATVLEWFRTFCEAAKPSRANTSSLEYGVRAP
jgi:hypothetical protein